ncbi:hypothetical protein BJ684DRAFT_15055 [Piptocephalis cylindrospora]|uniref:SS18 N-terminal domain-containing protein n=1 Tax=Piptocephalis cylindrospora TaxID=1907219 RepID=A0A4P9Y6C7_9FUNG|nr:hypothetical protein BJ684DRAFT_15055 [Piptocephalis cylindrospora]|eukprot:RKP14628.1 hypothetical protein BJ684DRAFT_15055 [Piptocephalis cylindrospora]
MTTPTPFSQVSPLAPSTPKRPEEEGKVPDASPAPNEKSSDKGKDDASGGHPVPYRSGALNSVGEEVERASFVPELTPRVVETVLQVNSELIRVCIDYQNRGWINDPDLAIFQARLQSNLTYLAAVADHYIKPTGPPGETLAPEPPQLPPLPEDTDMPTPKVPSHLKEALAQFAIHRQAMLAADAARLNDASRAARTSLRATMIAVPPHDTPEERREARAAAVGSRVWDTRPADPQDEWRPAPTFFSPRGVEIPGVPPPPPRGHVPGVPPEAVLRQWQLQEQQMLYRKQHKKPSGGATTSKMVKEGSGKD